MADNKQYLTSKDIKEVLQRELNLTLQQKLKNDLFGIGIWFGVVFFLWTILYYLLIWFNSNLNIFEFSVIFFTILSTYIFAGYLFYQMDNNKDNLLKNLSFYGARENLAGVGAMMGCIFFPSAMIISLSEDFALGFKYSERDIELAGKMISYLKNDSDIKDGITFAHIKKIFIDNSVFNIPEIRKVINFMFKNGLVRVDVNEKNNDESRLFFIRERYEDIFKEYKTPKADEREQH